jgi:hypothetical protein
MIQSAKKLVAENGILYSITVNPGKMLPPETGEMASQFYISLNQQDHTRKNQLCCHHLRQQEGSSSGMNDKYNPKQSYLSYKEQNPEKLLVF